ncbi:hypothetical protein BUALT_Bualt14G0082200 [Buddleja alternifolia]|uniref:SBP-type domain-containing protein n=1 Tax=Buddleja alternifolia TaxID=168488 RepID=A0AAV6WIT7_9LAMI|nr:hypothetical protein BUALT_Bualt14G0082200 [Buddleja alternifolia]
MQQNTPPPPIPFPPGLPTLLETPSAATPQNDPIYDWFDFLDFNISSPLNIPSPHHTLPEQPGSDQVQPPDDSGRVRKRDPKLVCPNFLAGRIPCACPEMDAMLEEEEAAALPGKKRTRTVRVSGGPQGRCQVSGCEADISELKGYHKRHRVCLRCANASSVLLDGENKRYCQQCGKFHLLSDFDEGKRSCRRKLERHNNRRRRKPNGSKRGGEKEGQQISLADDVSEDDDTAKGVMYVSGDDDARKDVVCVSNQSEERGISLEPDGHVSTLRSAPGSQNLQRDTVASFAGSDETRMNEEKQNTKYNRSESYSDKNTFSSTCPSGRISFKLYDWNPAEFPRRLRHQIFQWLASMPIELEGYIRPGCTILTAFIAMPKPMWLKLSEQPAFYIKDLVASPRSVLSGRGTMLVHLNDAVFHVTKDATSIVKLKVKNEAPKLHYIYPTCFEAGKPMEFIACGSDLLQPKFQFLVSFAGKYLAHNISVSSLCCKKGDTNSLDHQYLRIYISQTDLELFGPAFIEVENQSGLSNFIPILIGDKETCTEMEILQQKIDTLEKLPSCPSPEYEVFALRQAKFSDFVLDVAWSLKKPITEQQFTSSHVQRFNYLLNFLIEKESSIILERVFHSLKSAKDNNLVAGVSGDDISLLQKNMDIARSVLDRKVQGKDSAMMRTLGANVCSQSLQNDNRSAITAIDKGMQKAVINNLGAQVFPPSTDASEIVPLLNDEVVMNVRVQERPTKLSCQRSFTRTFFTSRPLLLAIAAIGVCCGVCAVVLHPQRVTQIATTIRRCLFDSS